MSDVGTAPAVAPALTTPKKSKGKSSAASKKPRVKPSHPRTSDMVNAAIKNLKERGGSSLQAIKKYISANYKVDAEKMAPFIRKYLKSAVTTGSLVQTKGKGAFGSFKLASAGDKPTTKKASKPRSAASKAKKSKPAAPKIAAVKKSASSTPKKAPAKPKAVKSLTPSKAKKTTKAPTKKPKTPKPKKVGAAKSPKKAAPKKK